MEIKIVHFSDTHNRHKQVKLEECDIAIFSGDMSGRGKKSEVENFMKWFSQQTQCTEKIVIAGNHDIAFDPKFEKETESNSWLDELLEKYESNKCFHYLENCGINLYNLNIWGSPITPWFHGNRWAFNKYRGDDIKKEWEQIPKNTDIIVTHGPVMYKLDYVPENQEYTGCEDLRKIVKEIKPKLHLSGHIHEGYGIEEDANTIYSNACICNHRYEPVNKPNIFKLEI